MWEWCCVITGTLYVYFVDHAAPLLHPFDFYEIISILVIIIILDEQIKSYPHSRVYMASLLFTGLGYSFTV